MHRRLARLLVATAAIAGIAAAAPAAMAAPTPTVIAESGSGGTGSALLDAPIGLLKVILCGGTAGTHPIPFCNS
ncbi:hypothetical protein [Nocardia sp. AG03]|uniref:hypothetical protein n=1 Tax=Nocardia sp. AG03 TaxID=3025312 RepID=UPI00241847B6|nr:hypothetical protein [Nocardia sp. AG03]